MGTIQQRNDMLTAKDDRDTISYNRLDGPSGIVDRQARGCLSHSYSLLSRKPFHPLLR